MRKATAMMVLRAHANTLAGEGVTFGPANPAGDYVDGLYFGKDGVLREAIRAAGGRYTVPAILAAMVEEARGSRSEMMRKWMAEEGMSS